MLQRPVGFNALLVLPYITNQHPFVVGLYKPDTIELYKGPTTNGFSVGIPLRNQNPFVLDSYTPYTIELEGPYTTNGFWYGARVATAKGKVS